MSPNQRRLVRSWIVGGTALALLVIERENRPVAFGVFALATLIMAPLRRALVPPTHYWLRELSRRGQVIVLAYYVSVAALALVLALHHRRAVQLESPWEFFVGFAILIAPGALLGIRREARLFRDLGG